MTMKKMLMGVAFLTAMFSCKKEETITEYTPSSDQAIIDEVLNLDLNNLDNYANQNVPNYITKNNTPGFNPITDAGATLGRVLFYDKQLSVDFSTACASCHQQENAFGDLEALSQGVNGLSGRHSMRLVNASFSVEEKFFWDERANDLEEQSTMPIQDHVEMGFSGQNGDLSMSDLIHRLENLSYYPILFEKAFGSPSITEEKMQLALSQFIRSIQSFDAKYDEGRAQVNNDGANFPNFSVAENSGKQLFLAPPQFNGNGVRIGGGAGCGVCHAAPEFDIDPNSLSNGVLLTPDGSAFDLTITRSPSLRNVTKVNGDLNGPYMHTGNFTSLIGVIGHYDSLPNNTNLQAIDPRLLPNGNPQQLQLTEGDKANLVAFLRTLAGSDIYTNPKWSNPFK